MRSFIALFIFTLTVLEWTQSFFNITTANAQGSGTTKTIPVNAKTADAQANSAADPANAPSSAATESAAPPAALHYTIRYPRDGSRTLEIVLSFTGNPDGQTILILPDEWAGYVKLHEAITQLRVLTNGVELKTHIPTKHQITDTAQATTRPHLSLVHEPNEKIELSYRVQRQEPADLDVKGFYLPFIESNYIHFFGHMVFLYPAWKTGESRSVVLNWENLPRSWSIANSHGVRLTEQRIHLSIDHLLHAVYTAGDFRLHRFEVKGRPVYLAIRGRWQFEDQEFVELNRRIFAAQRDFFQDHDYPFYLLTLLPTWGPCCGKGGTGLTNSFAVNATSPDLAKLDQFKHLLSHELFHNWNGRKIKRLQPERLVYWFSEGFTDYYAAILNLRAGIITLPELVTMVNHNYGVYKKLSVRNAPNEKILKDFWNNPEIQKLPYYRGALIAFRWNQEIKKQSRGRHSLDDLMRDLLRASQKENAVVSADTLDRLSRRYLSYGLKEDLERFVEKGESLDLTDQALGPCVKIVSDFYELDQERYDDDPETCIKGI
ncbi:MAG: hypothetical protein AB1540_00440 [Bdellovibrionota bacterium]